MPVPFSYEDPCGVESPRIHAKISTETHTLAYGTHPLRDGTALGGYKEPRILDVGTMTRAASDPLTGAWSAQTASLKLADTDRLLRDLSDKRGGFRNCDVEVYLTSHLRRLAGGLPRVMFAGKIYSDQANEDLTMSLSLNDVIGVDYSLFSDEKLIPQRTVTRVDFPDAPDDAVGHGIPIIYGNVSNIDSGGAGVVEGIHIGQATFKNQTSTIQVQSASSPETLAAVVADLQAAVTAGTTYVTYGGRIGYADALALQALGTVPNDYEDLAAVIGYSDLDSLLAAEAASVATSGGVTYEMVLIAGHALKAIKITDASPLTPSIWINDVQMDPAQLGVSVFAPGIAGDTSWATRFGTAPYTDVVGSDGQTRRYTIIFVVASSTYGTAIAGGATVRVECTGIEDVGDGSGTLLTNLYDQYEHFLVNWGLQSYQTGAWLSAPTFTMPDGTTTIPRIDADSFDRASDVSAEAVAGGYVGAGVIGSKGVQQTIRSVVADFNISAGTLLAQNDYGQLSIGRVSSSRAVFLEDPYTAAAHPEVRDQTDVMPGMTIQQRPDWQVNRVTYTYAMNYATGAHGRDYGGGGTDTPVQDAMNQRLYGVLEKGFDFKFLRDDASALAAASYYLNLFKRPPRIVRYTRRGLCGLHDDVLMGIPLTHWNGYGQGGWKDHAVWILSKTFDPKTMTCTFEALDVEALIPATSFTTAELRSDPDASSGLQIDGSSEAAYRN